MHRGTSTFSSPVNMNPKFPEHEHLRCPRCDSGNTKFCYYNNYNLSQPRHFCKNCRRYWTKGGTLRNIPIGGGTRKISKRSSNSSKRTSTAPAPPKTLVTSTSTETPPPVPAHPQLEAEPPVVHRLGGDELVESSGYPMGPFGNLLMEGLNFNLESKSDEDVLIRNPIADDFRSNFLRLNDNNDQNGGSVGENGWPDLSIFTPPGSSFH